MCVLEEYATALLDHVREEGHQLGLQDASDFLDLEMDASHPFNHGLFIGVAAGARQAMAVFQDPRGQVSEDVRASTRKWGAMAHYARNGCSVCLSRNSVVFREPSGTDAA